MWLTGNILVNDLNKQKFQGNKQRKFFVKIFTKKL